MVWCDMHEAFHENQAIQEYEGGPQCGPDDWRRVFIEPRWYRTCDRSDFGPTAERRSGGALPGSALRHPEGRPLEHE
jgi:hypothetical protein